MSHHDTDINLLCQTMHNVSCNIPKCVSPEHWNALFMSRQLGLIYLNERLHKHDQLTEN